MTGLLQTISSTTILVFAVSSMLAAGLGHSLREIVAPLREPRRVARALIGNFVLVPLLAVSLAYALSLEPALSLGLVLLGTAAGTPFLVRLVAIAKGDVALGTALLVLLVPVTVVYMPIAVPLFAPDVAVEPFAIAAPLVLTLLVPLAIGLAVAEKASGWAKRLRPLAHAVSTCALVLLLASTLLVNLGGLVEIVTSRAIVAVLLFVLGSFVIGHAIATPYAQRQIVLGLGTAQRNIAAATVVAAEGFRGPDTLVLVIVVAIAGLLLLIPIARWLRGWMRR